MNELKTLLLLSSLLWLMALSAIATASPSSALKRYESGKYDSALREYKRLLMEKPNDPRLHFNAGAAAFQMKDFEEAIKQFNAALVTPDLRLQERSYYDLGNTEYYLGEGEKAVDKKRAHWSEAIHHYEIAYSLTKDDDAKFNMEQVKKQIEELDRAEREAGEAWRQAKKLVEQHYYTEALKTMEPKKGAPKEEQERFNEVKKKEKERLNEIINIPGADSH